MPIVCPASEGNRVQNRTDQSQPRDDRDLQPCHSGASSADEPCHTQAAPSKFLELSRSSKCRSVSGVPVRASTRSPLTLSFCLPFSRTIALFRPLDTLGPFLIDLLPAANMDTSRRQSLLSQVTESSADVRSPQMEEQKYAETALLGSLASPPVNFRWDHPSSDPSSISSPSSRPSRAVDVSLQQQYHMRMRQANNEAIWNSAVSVSQQQRAQMQMHLPVRGRRGARARGSRSTSPYRSRTDKYRLSMRDAAAASLWTAWQDTSLSLGEERTRHIFSASRRLS